MIERVRSTAMSSLSRNGLYKVGKYSTMRDSFTQKNKGLHPCTATST